MLALSAMFVLSVLVLVVALLVRIAGSTRIFFRVDYSRGPDARALHAWAGDRLLLNAAVSFGLYALASAAPRMANFLLAGLLLGMLSSAVSLAIGVAKFQSGR
jgi:hypothetical protein